MVVRSSALGLRFLLAGVAGAGIAQAILLAVGMYLYPQLLDVHPPASELAPLTALLVGRIAFCVLGLLIVAYAPQDKGALMLGLAVASEAVHALSLVHWRLGDLPFGTTVGALTHGFGAATGVRAFQLYPRPLTKDDVYPTERLKSRIRVVWRFLAWLLRPARVWIGVGGLYFILAYVARTYPTLADIAPAAGPFILGTAAVYIWSSYRKSDVGERAKIFWVLQAVVFVLAMDLVRSALLLAFYAAGIPMPGALRFWIEAVIGLGAATCLFIGIFRSGALNGALVLRRTTVLSLSISAVLFGFAVLEGFIGSLLSRYLGLSSDATTAIFGAALAIAFKPIQKAFDRISQYLPQNQPQTREDAPPQ